ncbi:MAG: hypothetical protein AAGU74_08175 [Bacillota bacterium]
MGNGICGSAGRDGGQRLLNRLHVRLPDDEYMQFRDAMADDGYGAEQDYIRMMIGYYMARRDGYGGPGGSNR